ncbi:anthranilate synthase family protein [Herbidospora mongoliensis]|uniref:anthranilate synthase family protein n=1 Tax=Herbidospora mongoliensis TaxID=688067 RepID=UPI00082FA20F|nr:anthranilate synthase family protein [Herbidospora mongoliensis]
MLDRLLSTDPPPFALLHRPGSDVSEIDVLVGDISAYERIADIPLSDEGADRHETLVVLPYRQIRERGYECPDDAAPLLAMTVTDQSTLSVEDALRVLPNEPIVLRDDSFDTTDAEYEAVVRRVLAEEIGEGTGANFVIKRTFSAKIDDWSHLSALSYFRRLLGRDPGCHWTFVIWTGTRTFVGSSPERHITLESGNVVMNPISGTYRYPRSGPELPGVLDFLDDDKEAGELYMVLDEELKMMGRVCEQGGRAIGPHLKQLARIAHTEYLIEGRSSLDVRDILRETLFAPTVTGGPLESACRVISKFEPEGRDYYAGMVALIGRDPAGDRSLDSAILIRTADISSEGEMRISVGATLVRDSDPASEAAETRAKAAGLLEALQGGTCRDAPAGLNGHPAIYQALMSRNEPLAGFWFEGPESRDRRVPELSGLRVLVIDAEDTFTAMARHIIRALGCDVTVTRYDEPYDVGDHDLVIVGPGPGDPRDLRHPKIARLRETTRELLDRRIPFLAVCLGHQVLCTLLGLSITRNPFPNQGVQRTIPFFGRREQVGFYNTFAARCSTDFLGEIAVSREEDEVHALIGPGFASVQFHPASVLTRNGVEILADLLKRLTREDATC